MIREKRKSINLKFSKDCEFVLKVPLKLSKNEISNFMDRHKIWMESTVNYHLEIQKYLRNVGLKNTNRIIILGREREVVNSPDENTLLDGEFLYIGNPRSKDNPPVDYIFNLIEQVVRKRVIEMSSDFGFKYKEIRLGNSTTVFGTCNERNVLRFTRMLFSVPPDVIGYVVAHELCHTRFRNHSSGFWNSVENIVPDWKEKRRWLRENYRLTVNLFNIVKNEP